MSHHPKEALIPIKLKNGRRGLLAVCEIRFIYEDEEDDDIVTIATKNCGDIATDESFKSIIESICPLEKVGINNVGAPKHEDGKPDDQTSRSGAWPGEGKPDKFRDGVAETDD